MNILFFGASVTKQQGDSGFVPCFQKIIKKNNFNCNVIQKGYGSMHLHDAGICKINDVMEQQPNICFVDWFSTGYILTDKIQLFLYLDAIVYKLMTLNCQICFLLLQIDVVCENRIKMYNLVKEYCKTYLLDHIELYNNLNANEILRDSVHTNNIGAEYYANTIFDYFVDNMMNKNTIYSKIPCENEYSNIKTLQINKEIHDEITLTGNFKIIGILQKIGNFSGLVEITRNDEISYLYNNWDQWCHYTRDNIKINTHWSSKITIKITQNEFNTSNCKVDFNFSNIQKYMYIYDIYFLGDLFI